MNKLYPPVYYADYLHLDKLLNSQELKSSTQGDTAHDEMLFIIAHQVHELWFKQIIHELDSVIEIFQLENIEERNIATAVARIQRINEINKLLIDTLHVLDTMVPLDFFKFRDYLLPASGFQSYQFRLIENKIGLKTGNRVQSNSLDHLNALNKDHRRLILQSMESISLFELVEKWLERNPFLKTREFSFWEIYKQAVESILDDENHIIMNIPSIPDRIKEVKMRQNENNKEYFEALFNKEKYNEFKKQGWIRLSLKAIRSAIFVNLYRDEPILNLPHKFLNSLIEMDQLFTDWRYRHAIMVHRMIGSKVGTGGSSGHPYLLQTVEGHRVFTDLFNLSTYLIPRDSLPDIPKELEDKLGFYYSNK